MQPALTNPTDNTDLAWASIKWQSGTDWLRHYCQNIERLFRINPFYVIHAWQKLAADHYRINVLNESNQQTLNLDLNVSQNSQGLRIDYDQGLKASTSVELSSEGLKIIDDYSRYPQQERQQRIHEVDRSLLAWANAIRRDLVWRKRMAWLPPWGLFMDKVWYKMKPSSRRIAKLLILLTAAEFIVFVFIMAVYISST